MRELDHVWGMMSVDKVAAFTEILAQDPGNAFARYGLAIEYTQRGETDLAMEQFDTLQKLHPDYTAGYQMAAQTLMASGNTQQAEARLRAGIESRPPYRQPACFGRDGRNAGGTGEFGRLAAVSSTVSRLCSTT